MACECLGFDGAKLSSCTGLCREAIMINPDKQKRAMEDSFTNNQLNQIANVVNNSMMGAPIINRSWQEGFIMGFKEGYEYGQ